MDKKFLGLAILLILTFIAFVAFVVATGTFNVFSRANNNSLPSLSNSLVFAWPLEVVADGKARSEVSVFIRNAEGKGVANKQVSLTSSIGTFQAPTATTSDDGKAVFSITSSEIGVAQIDAMVDNRKLQRSISVKFK